MKNNIKENDKKEELNELDKNVDVVVNSAKKSDLKDADIINIKKFNNKESAKTKGSKDLSKKDHSKSFSERTRVFFSDLKIKFKNMFAPEKDKTYLPEYYDLPYRYNKDTVKILAQTPHKLFVYWDFNDEMKKEITDKYGEEFWLKSYPVLIVENISRNYSFEVKIDDFANSWYIDIPDNASKYNVTIGRKLIDNFEYNPKLDLEKKKTEYIEKYINEDDLTKELLEIRFKKEFKDEYMKVETNPEAVYRFQRDDFVYFGRSNELESPSGKVMVSSLKRHMLFKDVRTNSFINLEIADKSPVKNIYSLQAINASDEKNLLAGSSWMASSSKV